MTEILYEPMNKIGLLFIVLFLNSCCWFTPNSEDCRKECFEDSILKFPAQVTNVTLEFATMPTYVGENLFPPGSAIGVPAGALLPNEFYSIERVDSNTGIRYKFFFNQTTDPLFSGIQLKEVEEVTIYKVIQNLNFSNAFECTYVGIEETIVDFKNLIVKTDGGTEEIRRPVTLLQVPSGKWGIFKTSIFVRRCYTYQFSFEFEPGEQASVNNLDSFLQEDPFQFPGCP